MTPAPQPDRPRHGRVLAAYALAVAWFTFPLLPRFTNHIAGLEDCQIFVWELWWFHHAVYELHQSPLTTSLIFYPVPSIPLIWSTPYNIALGLNLVGLFGPVVTYNLLVVSCLFVAALGAYALAWHLTRRQDAAFLAGLIYAFAPAHMSQVRGHLGVMSIQWAPWCVLALIRLYEAPSWKRAGAFGVAVALAASTDVYASGYFLGTFLPLFALYHLITNRQQAIAPAFLFKALAVGAAAALAVLPFYLPMLQHINGSAAALEHAQTVHAYSQDVLQWLLPPEGHRILGRLFTRVTANFTDGDTDGYIGWTVLALAAYALTRVRGLGFWALFTAAAMIISLGTYLHVDGPTRIPMPYLLVTHLPVLSNLRCPGRAMEAAMLGFAVLAAMGLAAWPPARRKPVFAALVAAVVFEFTIYAPFPTTSAAVPTFYEELAHDPTAGALFELPNGDPTWGGPTYRWMYYQTHHHHPLVAAHTHRIPDGAFAFIDRYPAVGALYHLLDKWVPATPEQEREVSGVLASHGVTHVIVHRVPGFYDGRAYDRLEARATRLFGPPVFQDGTMAVHRTHPPASQGPRAEIRTGPLGSRSPGSGSVVSSVN